MDKIRVGDLVVVVRHPCCGAFIGSIFRVTRFIQSDWVTCDTGACPGKFHDIGLVAHNDNGRPPYCAPVAWLKRIPPLTEPESITTDEGVTA